MNLKTIEEYISILDDDHKLRKRWQNKKIGAKRNGIECKLSFAEYCYLVEQVGLKSSDLGYKGKNFVLARYNDKGDYELNNCRFITQYENLLERKTSIAMREAGKQNFQKAQEKLASLSKKEISKSIKNGKTKSLKHQRKKLLSILKNRLKYLSMNHQYCGKHNSQFSTYWLTNGLINIKWSDKKGPCPNGFKRGRKI